MPANVTDTTAVRDLRQVTENAILQLLLGLVAETGLDLETVTVRTMVRATSDDGDPRQVPFAVKIVLAV